MHRDTVDADDVAQAARTIGKSLAGLDEASMRAKLAQGAHRQLSELLAAIYDLKNGEPDRGIARIEDIARRLRYALVELGS